MFPYIDFVVISCLSVSALATSEIFPLSNASAVSNAATGEKYEVRLVSDLYTAMQLAVPVTSCHDSSGGSGGEMSFTVSIGITPDTSVSLSLANPILNLFSLSGTFEVSRIYTITSTYTCKIPKGSRGQIWAAPFAVVGSVQHRVVYMDDNGKELAKSGWTKLYDAKIPSAISPMFSCRTDKYVACTIPVPQINIDLASEIPETF